MIQLDTDTVVALFRGNRNVAERVKSASQPIGISSIVLAELYYGAEASKEPAARRREIESFLNVVSVVPFGAQCAVEYGRLRQALKTLGRPTGEIDAFIGATALAHRAILVTHNRRHYEHMPELRLEDWV